ncbi:N-acetyltransferase [Streptomyces millisiae]|uniref:N-acetyltransferase n=1 Tax=Streptomyces millisiae TaxID=3075542 RepID=A0ABU2LNW8_9ACTN|nr:N-acetyltransferase [Streptomyces sp. DSM 44918]MDT0318927.1 N-acetyltransferase [Streptomyces sp. DSM 44918]
MDLLVTTAEQRPDLLPLLGDFHDWPTFMDRDPVAPLYYSDVEAAFPEFVLIAVDRDHPDRLVAKGYSVPFTWDGDPDESLPAGGWDEVILTATRDRLAGRRGTMVSALEISVRPELRGTGLSSVMLDAMRRNAADRGYASLVAPVRPSAKHRHPELSMADYADARRDDGLPVDPWLRVHIRAGGRIVGVSVRAMTIAGSLAEWRQWTGLPFDTTGDVNVPGALVPVHCDTVHDRAVYCEPCVWVHHRLS